MLGSRKSVLVSIEVTQDDIDNGVRSNCRKCPVARALRRAFPTATYVRAGGSHLSVYDQGEHLEVATPRRVMLFMGLYDCEHTAFTAKPFTFTAKFRKLYADL